MGHGTEASTSPRNLLETRMNEGSRPRSAESEHLSVLSSVFLYLLETEMTALHGPHYSLHGGVHSVVLPLELA